MLLHPAFLLDAMLAVKGVLTAPRVCNLPHFPLPLADANFEHAKLIRS